MKGLFELQTPGDLYRKLEWEFSKLAKDPKDSRVAYNFIVTAYHLLEWVLPETEPDFKTKRQEMERQCPALEICHHLSIGAKHFVPTNPKLTAVRETGRASHWHKNHWGIGYWHKNYWADALTVELVGRARDAYGKSISLKDLADTMMEFWQAHFRTDT